MHITGWDLLTVKGKIGSGTGVLSYRTGKLQVKARSYRSVYTHAGHHTADENAVHFSMT